MKIKASVLHGPNDLRIQEREIEPPVENEVQVSVKCTTLCGSDMHYFKHGANGDFKVREPLSLGHESSGIVEAIGSKVTNLKIGDKVALEVGIPCLECKLCKQGRYNLCKEMKFRSSAKIFPHFQGTLQQLVNCPANFVHKVPDMLSLEYAALAEPLAVAVHASNRTRILPGSTVLVLGAGAVGLFVSAMAKICGATNIVIADISKDRLKFAVDNGFANHSFEMPMNKYTETQEKVDGARSVAEQLQNVVSCEFDYTFECTGVESCVQTGIFATVAGGKFVMVGMGTPIQTLHIGAAALREVDMIGVFRYANAYPIAIDLMAKNMIPALDKFITHRVEGLDNVDKACELAGKSTDKEGKSVIKVAILS